MEPTPDVPRCHHCHIPLKLVEFVDSGWQRYMCPNGFNENGVHSGIDAGYPVPSLSDLERKVVEAALNLHFEHAEFEGLIDACDKLRAARQPQSNPPASR